MQRVLIKNQAPNPKHSSMWSAPFLNKQLKHCQWLWSNRSSTELFYRSVGHALPPVCWNYSSRPMLFTWKAFFRTKKVRSTDYWTGTSICPFTSAIVQCSISLTNLGGDNVGNNVPGNRMDKIPGVISLLPATAFHKATQVHKM